MTFKKKKGKKTLKCFAHATDRIKLFFFLFKIGKTIGRVAWIKKRIV